MAEENWLNRTNVQVTIDDATGEVCFYTNSGAGLTKRVTIDSNGNVGIGTTSPTSKLHVIGDIKSSTAIYGANSFLYSGDAWQLVCAHPATGTPTHRMYMGWYVGRSQFEIETWDSVNGWSSGAVNFLTSVNIYGNLTKSSGSFKIDHPLFPKTKYLYHGFVEAPRYDLIYRGVAKLRKGRAIVNIDEASNMTEGTFDVLCQNAIVVSLQNLTGFAHCKSTRIKDGSFDIICEEQTNDLISWVVMAERKDDFIIQSDLTDNEGHLLVEIDKTLDEIRADNDLKKIKKK